MPVVGIYSFPKSGNTWVRNIIAALFEGGVSAVPDLYQKKLSASKEYNGFRFYKHHSGTMLKAWKDEQLNTSHVIHIRRNPLDVFLSYLNFHSDNVTGNALIPFESVDKIAGTDLFKLYFHTFVLTGHIDKMQPVTKDYFAHNLYWLDQQSKQKNVRCIRYEDMLENPAKTLGFLKEWLGLTDERLQDIIDVAQVRTGKDGKFFWRQEERNYLNYLSDEDIDLFLKYRLKHSEQIGYSESYFRMAP